MTSSLSVFLGIDSGATTCKVNGIDADGDPISNRLRQYPTRSNQGREAILDGWCRALEEFVTEEGISDEAVAGVGLAMPGPFSEYGVLGELMNYPEEFNGWRYLEAFADRLQRSFGRKVPVATANDGHLAGLGEAAKIQQQIPGSVFMLAPGSGLGSAFINAEGRMLEGDHCSAAFFCCMPIPYQELGLPKFSCKSGRDWGSAEAYTALSGLPLLIREVLLNHPDHEFNRDPEPTREHTLSLRSRAVQGDPLALEVFDLQARAMGYVVAMAALAYDPTHVVIGGGLMDPEATTEAFREGYLKTIRETALPYLWANQLELHFHQARLGEHSQAIGAAQFAKIQA